MTVTGHRVSYHYVITLGTDSYQEIKYVLTQFHRVTVARGLTATTEKEEWCVRWGGGMLQANQNLEGDVFKNLVTKSGE